MPLNLSDIPAYREYYRGLLQGRWSPSHWDGELFKVFLSTTAAQRRQILEQRGVVRDEFSDGFCWYSGDKFWTNGIIFARCGRTSEEPNEVMAALVGATLFLHDMPQMREYVVRTLSQADLRANLNTRGSPQVFGYNFDSDGWWRLPLRGLQGSRPIINGANSFLEEVPFNEFVYDAPLLSGLSDDADENRIRDRLFHSWSDGNIYAPHHGAPYARNRTTPMAVMRTVSNRPPRPMRKLDKLPLP